MFWAFPKGSSFPQKEGKETARKEIVAQFSCFCNISKLLNSLSDSEIKHQAFFKLVSFI